MSNGYTKLFSDIVDSSIWEEPPETCKVWVTLLALSDADGFIRGSVGWLAGKSRVALEQCQKAVDLFQQPDHRSRTPDNDGKRIELVPDGFLILNYLAFRDRLSNDPVAVATRERVRIHRERYKALRNEKAVTPCYAASASEDVSDLDPNPEGGCKGDGGKSTPQPKKTELPFNSDQFREAWEAWKEHRRRIRKPMTNRAEALNLKNLPSNEDAAIRWIDNAIEKGWQGIYEPDNTKGTPNANQTRATDHRRSRADREYPEPVREPPRF